MTTSPGNPSTVARSREKVDSDTVDLISLEAEEILALNDPFSNVKNLDKEESDPSNQNNPIFRGHSHKKRNIIWLITILILIISTPAYADKATTGNKIARGVSIDNITVGGMTKNKAISALESRADKAVETPITFTLGESKVSVSSQDLDLKYDINATINKAYGITRTYNPISIIPSFFERTFFDKNIDVIAKYDDTKFDATATNLVNTFSKGRVDAGVKIEGTNVEVIEPKTGTGITLDQAREALFTSITSFNRKPISLNREKVEAQITLKEAEQTAKTLRTMFSQDSTLATPAGNKINITKEHLAASTIVTPKKKDLVVSIDQAKMRASISDQLNAVEVAPQDATFSINGNSVSVIPSVVGKQIDFVAATKQWLSGEHIFNASVIDIEPKRNTQWAQSLNITEPVSSFSTNFPAGQERVKNIRRAAEVVNGTVVEPGQKFSLNEVLGPRTAASGYVQAPVFAESKGFFEDFGGGVSQFSTTLFNAFYMGGYERIAHKPHTIYISRYPLGREATINYGSVDMAFRNDSNSGVLIKTSVGSTSISVTIYGNKEGRKVTLEGPNTISRTEYTTEYVEDPALPPGKEVQLEAGYPGIVVENFRIIEKPGSEPKRERYRWSYKMIPRKVARNPQPAPQA